MLKPFSSVSNVDLEKKKFSGIIFEARIIETCCN